MAVYKRARILLYRSAERKWTQEEYEIVRRYRKNSPSEIRWTLFYFVHFHASIIYLMLRKIDIILQCGLPEFLYLCVLAVELNQKVRLHEC
jgi:hypothetical protein